MGEEIKNVQLKFSCPANWNNMSEAEGGRHCDICQKKVYDFTNSKAEEFQRILAENQHGLCGRFTREQMHMQPVVLPLWKKWLSAAMVLIGINMTSCYSSGNTHSIGDTVMIAPPAQEESMKIGKAKAPKQCGDTTKHDTATTATTVTNSKRIKQP